MTTFDQKSMGGRYGTPVSASSLSDNICLMVNSIVYLLSKRLSASVNSSISPWLFMYPCCDAQVLPVQPSGLADKETTLSFLLNPCIDKRHFPMLSSSFRAGTMTLTNGRLKLCCLFSIIIFGLFLIIGVFICE